MISKFVIAPFCPLSTNNKLATAPVETFISFLKVET